MSMDSPDEKRDFVSWFLREERHVDVAMRFAAKFCPELMGVVEKTLERATERARLAMGPRTAEGVMLL